MFKNFKYNPIDDTRFAMFQNRFNELSDISSIYGETTERFLEGMLSYKECIEFLAIINTSFLLMYLIFYYLIE